MEEIIKENIKKENDEKYEKKEIQMICNANDTIITAENEDDQQRLMTQFDETPLQYNMMI